MKIEDIVNKEFSRSFMGYDMKEVDVFLDAVIEQMEAMESERKEMLTALDYLLKELEQLEKGGNGGRPRVADKRSAAVRASAARMQREQAAGVPGADGAGAASPADAAGTPPRRPQPGSRAAQPADAAQEPLAEEIPTYVFAGGGEPPVQNEAVFHPSPVAEEFETGEAAPQDAAAAPAAPEDPAQGGAE